MRTHMGSWRVCAFESCVHTYIYTYTYTCTPSYLVHPKMLCPNELLYNGASLKLKAKIEMCVEKPFLSTAQETFASKAASEDETACGDSQRQASTKISRGSPTTSGVLSRNGSSPD